MTRRCLPPVTRSFRCLDDYRIVTLKTKKLEMAWIMGRSTGAPSVSCDSAARQEGFIACLPRGVPLSGSDKGTFLLLPSCGGGGHHAPMQDELRVLVE